MGNASTEIGIRQSKAIQQQIFEGLMKSQACISFASSQPATTALSKASPKAPHHGSANSTGNYRAKSRPVNFATWRSCARLQARNRSMKFGSKSEAEIQEPKKPLPQAETDSSTWKEKYLIDIAQPKSEEIQKMVRLLQESKPSEANRQAELKSMAWCRRAL